MNLNNFLNPKSIALIGASNNKKKLGYQILANLKEGGYRGRIYPVNLKDTKVFGLKAYQSINDIKSQIDLAVIVVPAVIAVEEVKKCAVAKIKNIVVISANFSESSLAGKKLEEEIKRIGKKNNLNILGPNCLGFVNHLKGINVTFAKTEGRSIFDQVKDLSVHNRVAFISQSGAVGSAVLDWSLGQNIKFSYFISLGNKAVLDENDFLQFLKKDKNTNLIIAYLEEIKEGEKFMEIISSLPANKKVAVLKAGSSKRGQKAAMSHTGSMAGSYEAYLAACARAGIINLNSLEESFSLIKLMQRKVLVENNKLHIVSNAGGPMVITTDLASRSGLELGNFSSQTQNKIIKNISALNTASNPLDILGDADAIRYQRALEYALADNQVSNLLILLTPQTSTQILKTAQVIVKLGKKYKNKMICAVLIGGRSLNEAKELLNKNQVPCFDYPDQAINALSAYLKTGQNKKNYLPIGREIISEIPGGGESPVRQLDYLSSEKIIKKYHIPTIPTKKISQIEDLQKINYPAVLKIVGEKIIHKTDKNFVALNLKDFDQAKNAFLRFRPALKRAGNYCIAQPMQEDGQELIIGFRRDKSFGPIIIVGAGGIFTEILQDVAREVSDVSYARALDMIKRLRIYPILKGARGQAGYDISELAKTIVKVAEISRENLEIKELDINPLFIKKKGVVAADIRIITGGR